MNKMKLIGPIAQLLTLDKLPLKGALKGEQLEILKNAGILMEDEKILEVGSFVELLGKARLLNAEIIELNGNFVALPGWIDCHTHICFGGSRAKDFAMRNAGKSYLEIAEAGGGIWDTVTQTRKLTQSELAERTVSNANRHLSEGVTTIEVKSGYGLNIGEELKMLRAIKDANSQTKADLIPTCLAAHIKPRDFDGTNQAYLEMISEKLFPILKSENLANRIDSFIEKSAFSPEEMDSYYQKSKELGFDLTVHADQFTPGGSEVAVKFNAKSADHLEASSILATFEKLSTAEVLSALTFRAAAALGLGDRGILKNGLLADFNLFPTSDYREILYHQGKLKPAQVWKKGKI